MQLKYKYGSDIVMSLIEVLGKVTKRWAFSHMGIHVGTLIMSYIDAVRILNTPEKAWSEKKKEKQESIQLKFKLSSTKFRADIE